MGNLKSFISRALIGVSAVVLMFSFGISAEAEVDSTVIDFPEYGIKKIVVPEGYPVLFSDGCSLNNLDGFLEEYSFDKEQILRDMADCGEILYIYSPDDSALYFIDYEELSEPWYCEESQGKTPEELAEWFSYYRDNMLNFSIESYPSNGTQCLTYAYKDPETLNYYRKYAFATKVGPKYYWIDIGLVCFDWEHRDRHISEFRKFVDQIELDFSSIDDVTLEPVPEVIDFPEYGIYNVKIPEGFSVFTRDNAYVTKAFYVEYHYGMDGIYQTFLDRPDRVARIINDDYTYELDIKAEDSLPIDITIWSYIPKPLYEIIYPKATFYDEYEVSSSHKGYWGGKYCVGALAYDTLRDYYFHRVNFANRINNRNYTITYNLNGYHKDFDDEITAIFNDSVENVEIKNSIRPTIPFVLLAHVFFYLLITIIAIILLVNSHKHEKKGVRL